MCQIIGSEPPANRLRRKQPIRERAHEQSAGANDARDIAKDLDRPSEIVDRYATDRVVERGVGERQPRLRIQIVHDPSTCLPVGAQFFVVHAEHGQVRGRSAEVGDPRAHEVEHVTVHAQLVVQRADRCDRRVVDMRHEARERIELLVVGFVGAREKSRR